MTVIIREATPDDAGALIAYLDDLAAETDIDIPLAPGELSLTVEQEREIVADYAASDNSILLVAEADGLIVGELNVRGGRRKAFRHAGDLGISVRRGWRDQGIGAMLLARAVAWARENPVIRRIELQVYARNERGIHLYQKFGFEVEGRRRAAIYQDGQYLDDLIMALLLPEKENAVAPS